MTLAIATTTIPGDLADKMEAAAAAGFDGIEIFENDILYFDRQPGEVRRMAEDLGLRIVALQPFRDFEAMPQPRRARNFDRAERKFDLMGELGTDLLLICSNVSPEALDDPARAAADLAELAERAKTRGLRVGYEALAWGRFVRDYQQAWDIVRRADHAHLGLVLDSFHLFCRGNSLDTIAEIPPQRIFLVQLADAPAIAMDPMQLSRHFRCFPGQGDYPVVEFMRRVNAIGYSGPLSHEIFSDEFRSAPPKQIALDGFRSMIWLRDQAALLAPAAHRRKDTAHIPPAPPLPTLTGIEFVEFASDGEEAEALVAALRSMGFEKTHVHRSKAVTLYRQGDINFVLNCEPDSFAHSYYLLHGTSVCALAFGTGQPQAMLDRSRHYKCEPFEGLVAPGELEIPAVRGIGGSLVYFVPRPQSGARFFDVDFQPVAGATTTGFGLTRIDHVAQAVAPTEFLSSLLFYRTVFGFEAEPQYDIVDPHGIVISRSISSADGTIRIPLNTSHARETSTQRFRTRYAGSGVQHIALACEDIFAVAERLNQADMLPIPDNYYDDLEAKFALEPKLLDRMRRYNVLYDEIGKGRFFHIYTRDIGGLFFEIVERQNYHRFGEANAAARLAAQARDYDRRQRFVRDLDHPSAAQR